MRQLIADASTNKQNRFINDKGFMSNFPEKDSEEKFEEIKGSLQIQSRFGNVTVQLENALYFPQGIVGMSEPKHFALAKFPKEGMENFKLLQCIDDASLSFVVLPLKLENPLIEKEDMLSASGLLNIPEERLLTLLIVYLQKSPDRSRITANVRAPIMIDIADKAGIQYVFSNSKYEICKVISS